jgi:putative FmdB family regulatory protein
MPLFEYVCTKCGLADEHLVRAPAPDRVRCGECGAEAIRQIPLLARAAADCGPTSSRRHLSAALGIVNASPVRVTTSS